MTAIVTPSHAQISAAALGSAECSDLGEVELRERQGQQRRDDQPDHQAHNARNQVADLCLTNLLTNPVKGGKDDEWSERQGDESDKKSNPHNRWKWAAPIPMLTVVERGSYIQRLRAAATTNATARTMVLPDTASSSCVCLARDTPARREVIAYDSSPFFIHQRIRAAQVAALVPSARREYLFPSVAYDALLSQVNNQVGFWFSVTLKQSPLRLIGSCLDDLDI